MKSTSRAAKPRDLGWAAEAEAYLTRHLAEADPEVAELVAREYARQAGGIELIASENVVSRAVLEAQGSWFSNKTVEGVPGDRYHGGAEIADRLEALAEVRSCRLFGAGFANVQPHSGSQANQAVFKALLKPGDRVLAMDLRAGGHLSHGSSANLSGQVYETQFYGVRETNGWLDYDALADQAGRFRPKLIVAGGSSYPRALDLPKLRAVAESVGALLLVDMAHFAGLVAGGVLENPVDHADIVTTTTYKSLRGARGGLILWTDETLSRKLRAGVFPGVQGSPLLNMIAAKAVGLGEALAPSFAAYASAVQQNARMLAETLDRRSVPVVTGGTDTPLVLVDLRGRELTGAAASDLLARAGITCNKNLVAGDPRSPRETSGLRFGVSAMTTRGADAEAMEAIGHWIADVLIGRDGRPTEDDLALERIRTEARALAHRYPYYPA
ncbi:MAG: serine hydroxymethyltransferase [Alphaproteobacteria bacterium]|nr:serine hydroxymethyltransferase [Alphaproteobacteria bacterium]